MDRRSFLKWGSLATVALVAQMPFPWSTVAAPANGVLFGTARYRTGGQGKILVSTDGGSTWKQHSNLGDMYTVSGLTVRANQLRLTAGFGNKSFGLTLAPDDQRWLTA
jgi:photosystem II stability/assembly factor-like uncharacterized protein